MRGRGSSGSDCLGSGRLVVVRLKLKKYLDTIYVTLSNDQTNLFAKRVVSIRLTIYWNWGGGIVVCVCGGGEIDNTMIQISFLTFV